MRHTYRLIGATVLSVALVGGVAPSGQSTPAPSQAAKPDGATRGSNPAPTAGIATPPGYVVGPDDVLGIVFWREKDLSADVIVRPDGIITLPLLNEIKVAGLTPLELRERVMAEASKLVEDANVTIVVKQVNSRKVFITGNVTRPGSYPLTAPTTVVQLIALAGGLLEWADESNIQVMRADAQGAVSSHKVNYKQLSKGQGLKQNIDLKPGDTVIVP
jgi:polysaccharide export outer membrane protein